MKMFGGIVALAVAMVFPLAGQWSECQKNEGASDNANLTQRTCDNGNGICWVTDCTNPDIYLCNGAGRSPSYQDWCYRGSYANCPCYHL